MKYALIGCGRIAPRHIQAALDNGIIPAAVCDTQPEQMENLLAHFGLEQNHAVRRYTDYRTMLREISPTLTAVALPSGLHGAVGADCLRQGSHLLVEKPAALSLKEAEQLRILGEQQGLMVGVCHQNRFNPPVERLWQAVQKGSLGKISHGTVQVRWHRDERYYRQAAWRGSWAEDGGVLMNQCIHGIDLLNQMMNSRPIAVSGVLRQRFHPYIEAEDLGLAVISYENGALGLVEGTANVYPENLEETLCLFGEKGTVCLGGRALERVEIWRVQGEPFEEKLLPPQGKADSVYGEGHTALYRDFLAAIRTGGKPKADLPSAIQAVELVLAIYKSHKEGRTVALPLGDFSTLEMEGVCLNG